jgi:hypothetical protein
MRFRTIIRVICLSAIVFTACSSDRDGSSEITIGSFSEKSNTSFFDEVYSGFRVIPLDLGENLLGMNALVRVGEADGGFLLTDQQAGAIYLLASDGSLVTRISKVGRGPGEYNELQICKYDDDSLLTLADYDHVIRYSKAGELVEEFSLDKYFADIFPLGGKEYALFLDRSEIEADTEDVIYITDASFNKTRSFLPMKFQMWNYGSHLSGVSGTDGRFFCAQQTSTDMYECDRDTVLVTYHFDLHGKEFPKKMVESEDYEEILDILMSTHEMYSIESAFRNDECLFFNVALILDGDDSGIGQWLMDRDGSNPRIEYTDLASDRFQFLGPPKMLTAGNEVVYLCDASFYDSVKDSFPGLAQYEALFTGGKCENFLLFCKIGE